MNRVLRLDHVKFGIPILIMVFLIVVPKTIGFLKAPGEVSIGILLDLLITIPVVYFLLIRKSRIPNFTVVYTFLIGIIAANLIIPAEHQWLLSEIKFVAIPVIEVGILGMLFYKMRSLNSSFQNTRGADFYDKLLVACNEVFPRRVGKILATEIAVAYYLFASADNNDDDEIGFTYFKKSGIKTIIGVFLFLVGIETLVVHMLASQWNPTVAWILSFLGVYTMIQVFSILRSLDKRLIGINYETEVLHLRYGFGCQTAIPFSSILKVEKNRKSIANDKSNVSLSLFDLIDAHNVIIYLKHENVLSKIYGMEKRYKSISLFIDDKDLFVDKIEQVIVVE